MKYGHLKRVIALILSVCILLLTAVMCISAEIPSDTAFIEVSGSGYDDANDYRGRSLNLTNAALNAYNANNSTALTIADITAVRVKTVNGAFLCGQFSSFIKDKLLNVEEIDLKGANVTTRNYAWQNDGYTDNAIYDGYFGVYSGTPRLTAVKKIILPDTLEIIMNYAFKNLGTLETIVFGNSLKSIGAEAFQNCSSLKALNFPDSLNQFTRDTAWYVYGCASLSEVSYHGLPPADGSDFFAALSTLIVKAPVVTVDLSNSGIDTSNALKIANKRRITYLNLSRCGNIEYGSSDGTALYERLNYMKSNGAEVLKTENSGYISTDGDAVKLSLHFGVTYYDRQETAYDDVNDIRGKSLQLTTNALLKYNTENSANISTEDITHLAVSCDDGIYLTGRFSDFIKTKLSGVAEIDMSDANVTTRTYAWETDGYTNNALQNQYFGIYSGAPRLTAIKRIILPDTLEVIQNYVFKNLNTLETVVFGNSLKSIGAEAFQKCSSLRTLELPNSLNEFTGDTAWYVYGCTSLTDISYHGAADGKNDFFAKLASLINNSPSVKVDISGSGIDAAGTLTIARNNNLTYLDISSCTEIDYTTDVGSELYSRLHSLSETGKIVIMSDNSAHIELTDGMVELNICFVRNDYSSEKALELTNGAINKYNADNTLSIVIDSIKAVRIKTAKGVYLNGVFADFITDRLPGVIRLDVSKSAIALNTDDGNVVRTELITLSNNGTDVIFTDVLGDANADGNFDILDIIHIEKYLVHHISRIINSESVVDLNMDGLINGTELTVMRKALLQAEDLEKYAEKYRNTYELTVGADSIGEYSYMGWFLTLGMAQTYQKMNSAQREQFLNYVFNGERVNYFGLIADIEKYYKNSQSGFDINAFKADWLVGKGGLLDEIAERGTDVFLNISSVPSALSGENPYKLADGCEQEFAQLVADAAHAVKAECSLNVKYVSLGDEPDGGSWDSKVIEHYKTVPQIKEYLKAYGMGNVGIAGPNTCIISQKWFNTLRAKENTWNAMSAVTGHDFSFGVVRDSLLNSSMVTGMPIFVTSMGILNEHTIASDFIATDKEGKQKVADYYTAIRNISAFLNDINKGANATMLWTPLVNTADYLALDNTAPNFYHIYYNENGKVFADNIATSANYDYYSQALNTVRPGARIYQTSTDREGTMGGSFEEYTMNATAAVNTDGTWGINLFNKTDSTVAKPYKNADYAPVPQEARVINVRLDIKGLYGSGEKEFKVYSTNINGGAAEEKGSIILSDGKGEIEVAPLELISLRSSESIGVTSAPLPIEQRTGNLTVALAGENYIIKNGEDVSLNSTVELRYYNDYRNCGIMLEVEDFAKLIGANYNLDLLEPLATVSNGTGAMTFNRSSGTVQYSGPVSGTLSLPESLVYKDGRYYFVLSDTEAEKIGKIFGKYRNSFGK